MFQQIQLEKVGVIAILYTKNGTDLSTETDKKWILLFLIKKLTHLNKTQKEFCYFKCTFIS